MAYDFFPKSETEIKKTFKNTNKPVVEDLVSLFNYLKKYDETPLVLEKSNPKRPKIKRHIAESTSINQILKITKIKNIALSDKNWGNGSSGNRGSANRGLGFESQFITSMNCWWEGKVDKVSSEYLTAIQDLDKTYKLSNSKNLKILHEGSNNTKRPIVFADSGITLLNKGSNGYDVGRNISDVTLQTDFGKVYLSLKLGNTVTFFNVGTKTILTMDDIINSKIRNASGLRLLKLFGIKEKQFCQVFNDGYSYVDTKAKADITGIKRLLRSGIGYGYHILHLYTLKQPYIKSVMMDKKMMERASNIGDVTVYYGGVGGSGRRVDIQFSSGLYNFKLNMRDTEGHTGYPTRLMCDFTEL